MTYGTFETSLEGGRPIELFEIALGSTIYRWTSAEDDVTFGGNDYEAIPITRGAFAQGPDDRDNTLELKVSSGNEFVREYVLIPPAQRATVTMRRVHRGDTDVVVVWKGRVQTVRFVDQNENAIIACLPEVGASSRPIPRQTFGGLCGNVLGDGQCQVVLSSFRYTGQVTAVSADGRTLTVDGLSGEGADFALAGKVAFGTDRRMILAQSGDDVTILLPFRSSPLGQNVDVTAGCDHTAETCATKFANLINFRGWPYVPTINVFETGLEG